MTKIKQLPSRSTVFFIAGVLTLFGIGLAAITHADERDERHDRAEREGRGLLNMPNLGNGVAKFNLRAPDFRVHLGEDSNVQVMGATVSATSSAGFSATTNAPPLVFNVKTDASTKFNVKGMGKATIANIAVGDIVNFRGVVLSGTTTSMWTVKAAHVEDKTQRQKPPKPPRFMATTTAKIHATTTAQLRIDALTQVVARLEAIIAELKLRFGL